MTSAKEAVELAVYEALAAAITGAAVYQDVPEHAPLPIVVVGDLKSQRLAGKEPGRDRVVTVTIVTMSNAQERGPLLALQAEIDAALDGQAFEPEGWLLVGAFEDDDATLQEDGETYAGVSTFTFMAISQD